MKTHSPYRQIASPILMPSMTEEELEARSIRELERMQQTRDAKRSGYTPRRRGRYENRG
ncbi:hypothetical protein DFW101_1065 [Solidesulfovibrio carbinoliphilus subsp. oakridgensis]|uniref:Uncharacterized protein n=1 Tax=Solidesulfovibrio carbinoliphilus subsp. oakridgensis TaxID=694327 RepID=G7Q660_9BACT|nr:hypothetical protein DFW101_1065 [Solidesulfovibrio carbinoliphilus subsp. oakridgensis]